MEYPGSRLTRPLRRTILLAFIAAFFIITPAITMYSAGYRYDWSTGLIRETGGLSIDIMPEDAKVMLDGLPLDASMPVRLKNIAPKKYKVTVYAEGYHTWEKEVEVRRKQTTYIKDIQLIKKSTPAKLSEEIVENLTITPDARSLLFTKNIDSFDIILFNLRTHRTTTLATFSKKQNINYHFSNRHSYVAVTVGEKPFDSVLIIDLDNPRDVTNIATLNKGAINKVQWKDSVEPILYFGTTSTLENYYPKQREVRHITNSTFADWFLSDGSLWTMDRTTSTIVIIKDRFGFNETFTVATTTDFTEFNPQDFSIETIYRDHILLRKKDNTAMLLINNGKQFLILGKKALVSPYNDWLLIWNDSELWTYALGEKPHLLNRSGATFIKVTPLDSYNTLALSFGDQTKALFPYEYIEQDLISQSITDLVADTESRQIYYSSPTGIYSLAY